MIISLLIYQKNASVCFGRIAPLFIEKKSTCRSKRDTFLLCHINPTCLLARDGRHCRSSQSRHIKELKVCFLSSVFSVLLLQKRR